MNLDPDKITPAEDRVLVRCDKNFREAISDGGIILPETVGHVELGVGTVVAVGKGTYYTRGLHKGKYVSTYLKPGDRVLFHLEGSEPIHLSDEDHHYEMIASEQSVLGTL